MDDPTRKTLPDDAETPPPDQPNEKNIQRGASESEFTVVSNRHDDPKKYQYAIPPSDPLEQTVEGRITYPEESNTTRATTPTIQHPNPEPGRASVPAPYDAPPPTAAYQLPPLPAFALPQRKTKNAPRQSWVWVVLVVILFAGGVASSITLFLVLRFANNNPPDLATATTEPPTLVAGVPTSTPAPSPTVGLEIQPWDGTRRLTILMMGIDKRPAETGTAFRTDSIMIISIDPKTKSVGILSIPRDLFVEIPAGSVVGSSYGLQRVNAAYVIGELAKTGSGPRLAMETVQYNLGMRINNYVVYEFNTVINAIDAIGGIDINVPFAINDPAYPDMYYGYDPLYIPAGLIHMNGTLALKYARTRHQTSDFDRTKRQQQVVLAARDKVLNANMAPQLIARAPQLWDQLSKTTRSDLTFDQMLSLAAYLKDIPKENIHQGVIDSNYVSGMRYNGQDILIPERARIGPLLQQVFGVNYNS